MYKVIRSDFLLIICLIIFLRLSLPFELVNTITIPSKLVLPRVFNFFEKEITLSFQSFEVVKVAMFIWGLGSLIQLGRFFLSIIKLKSIVKMIPKEKLSVECFAEFTPKKNVHVFTTKYVDTPTVFGVIKPIILLPDTYYSNRELKYILLHEYQHVKNKDILKKHFVEILIAIYWWMVPLYIFRHQISLIMEFNVDQQVTYILSGDEYFE